MIRVFPEAFNYGNIFLKSKRNMDEHKKLDFS